MNQFLNSLSILAVFVWNVTPGLAAEEIRIAASTTGMDNVFSKIDKPFTAETGIKIVYVGDPKVNSAIEQFKSVLDGKAEATTNTQDLADTKKQMFEALGNDPKINSTTTRTVARDIMRIAANQASGIKSLSLEQVADIFSGKVKNWKEVGGAELPVKIAVQTGRKGTVSVFEKMILKKGSIAGDRTNLDNHDEVVTFIEKNPGAIGFLPSHTKEKSAVLVQTEVIGRPVHLLILGKPSPNMEKLIRFISKDGAKYGVGR